MTARGLTAEELFAGIPDPVQDALEHASPAGGVVAPGVQTEFVSEVKAIDTVVLGALALDIAQGYSSPAAIAAAYEIDKATFARLMQSTAFQRELSAARNAVQAEGGLAEFRLRCRIAAEQLLPKLTSPHALMGANLSEIVSAFKALGEMADLKPKEVKQETGGGVVVNFLLPDMPGLPKSLTITSTGQPSQPGPPIDVEPVAPQPAYGFDFGGLPEAAQAA
jgi:hypothetical protein